MFKQTHLLCSLEGSQCLVEHVLPNLAAFLSVCQLLCLGAMTLPIYLFLFT